MMTEIKAIEGGQKRCPPLGGQYLKTNYCIIYGWPLKSYFIKSWVSFVQQFKSFYTAFYYHRRCLPQLTKRVSLPALLQTIQVNLNEVQIKLNDHFLCPLANLSMVYGVSCNSKNYNLSGMAFFQKDLKREIKFWKQRLLAFQEVS